MSEVIDSILSVPAARSIFDPLQLTNQFVDELPGDLEPQNFVREVRRACYSRVAPSQALDPSLVATSSDLLDDLGISEADSHSREFLEVMAGNRVHQSMKPYSANYGGHQFGTWAGQLGDGRAITLCELRKASGGTVALQLKGAGLTPYSRSADGLAVVRSSLREFICSEAMHHLGIPTTRALSLVLTGESVVRDILYDGHPAPEPGAVICRVSPTFLRFGNFQIHAARQEWDILKQLADFSIKNYFPELGEPNSPSVYVDWYWEICRRTVALVADWMRVGFVHGVMNTDNMSILGETIDYGPYGWLEIYDPNWTPNTTDASTRRYRYGQQPVAAQWNLLQLANSIVHLVGETQALEEVVNACPKIYSETWTECLRKKLGFSEWRPTDGELAQEMDDILQLTEIDLPLFFRRLACLRPCDGEEGADPVQSIETALYDSEGITTDSRDRIANWLRKYVHRAIHHDVANATRVQRMNDVNPLYVPRNYLAQLAIDRVEAGDFSYLHKWLEVLRHPYREQANGRVFAQKLPEWARNRPGCSMLSCSS